MRLRTGFASWLVFGLLLSSCGGSSPSGGSAMPSPTPTPAPPSSPAPSVSPGIFGLTSARDFAVLGYAHQLKLFPSGPPFYEESAPDSVNPIGFRFLQEVGGFEISIPGLTPARFSGGEVQGPTSFRFIGNAPTSGRGIGLSLLRPGVDNTLVALFATSLGAYNTGDGPSAPQTITSYDGIFAYGVPSVSGQLPLAGLASYDGVFIGRVISFPDVSFEQPGVTHLQPIQLQLDFSTGKVTGDMRPSLLRDGPAYELGRFAFNGTINRDQATFSATVTGPDGRLGQLEGQLNGGSAGEAMLRFQVPYTVPNSGSVGTFYGAAAAKLKS